MNECKIIRKTLDCKCPGCNNETYEVYSQDLPDYRNDMSSWLCANCLLDLIVDEQWIVKGGS